ncbi:hypothetical protein EDC01DRAFT_212357 [Geopyxis carbonaria]|nr:hypothetical protein EDC01DRAFT_212357 [Geopyxis carbonaria]
MGFFTNLITFSPLLFLAGIIIYLLERRDNLRRGAGLIPDVPENDQLEEQEAEEDYVDDVGDDPAPPPYVPLDTHGAHDPNAPEDSESEPESDAENGDADNGDAEAVDGPAQHQPRTVRTRTVGPKKMRSIQRRDQRRAYHEFLRSQAEQREEQENDLREEEKERAFENARRRALVEEEIAERKEKERIEREKAEGKLREREKKDADKLKNLLRGKKCFEVEKLARSVGRERPWVEMVLKREALMGVDQGVFRTITRDGWWISVGEEDLEILWGRLKESGKMSWNDMGSALEEILVK